MFWIHTSLTQWKIIHKKSTVILSGNIHTPPPKVFFPTSYLSSMNFPISLSHLPPVWLSSYEPGHTCFPGEPLECLPPSGSRRSSSGCPGWRQTCPYWPRSTRSGLRPPTAEHRPGPRSPRSTTKHIYTMCVQCHKQTYKTNINTQYTYTKYIHNAVASEADWK